MEGRGKSGCMIVHFAFIFILHLYINSYRLPAAAFFLFFDFGKVGVEDLDGA